MARPAAADRSARSTQIDTRPCPAFPRPPEKGCSADGALVPGPLRPRRRTLPDARPTRAAFAPPSGLSENRRLPESARAALPPCAPRAGAALEPRESALRDWVPAAAFLRHPATRRRSQRPPPPAPAEDAPVSLRFPADAPPPPPPPPNPPQESRPCAFRFRRPRSHGPTHRRAAETERRGRHTQSIRLL